MLTLNLLFSRADAPIIVSLASVLAGFGQFLSYSYGTVGR